GATMDVAGVGHVLMLRREAGGYGRRRPVLGGVGLDDDPARPLVENGLDGLAEHRRSGARGQRHDDGLGPHRTGLLDDQTARPARSDLLPVAGHAAPALELGLLDD